MNQEDLDRVLSSQGNIVPSSGFAVSVMKAVERAAATPPPIPFPWKYALPGLTAWLIALVLLVTLGPVDAIPTRSVVSGVPPMLASILEGLKAIHGGGIAVGLLVSGASVFFSMRMVGARV